MRMNRSGSCAVLVLEDDPNLGLILQEHLEMNGFRAKLCTNGADGLAEFRRNRWDLCLVDVMMPRMDGFTFAREAKRLESGIPLIFLTAKSLKEDRIEGLKIGADDYVTKPFSMEELLLRIQAVLKRSGKDTRVDSASEQFQIGSYTFHHRRRTLTRKGRSQRLTAREADLLHMLCLHMNGTLDRAHALEELWGEESYFTSRSMDVFVSKLRRFLKDDPTVEILSEHGRGIRLVVS
jgi:DNA-binding response OmpR family regulator